MREIGGYIELDNIKGQHYHENAIRLNCGRSCLTYLIKAKNIQNLYVPLYLCNTVKNCCEFNGVNVLPYEINTEFLPMIDVLEEDTYLYVVNYFGFLEEQIMTMVKKYQRVIVDNSQAFFCKPISGVDTIYVARKYFGVADGAYLYTEGELYEEIPSDITFNRMTFILGRYEKDASTYFKEYVKNNSFFDEMIMKKMSKLTNNLLNGFDYETIKKTRTDNYRILDEGLHTINKLVIPDEVVGAFGYPLLVEDGKKIKMELINRKIYVPTLWPEVRENCNKKSFEYDLAENLVILPVDQRYSENDMKYILSCIDEIMRLCNGPVSRFSTN